MGEDTRGVQALAQKMAECEKSGGGRVVVPKGKWLTGAGNRGVTPR